MQRNYFFLLFCVTICSSLGDKVRVTTIEEEPYLFKDGNKYTGFIPDLMEAIADKEDIDYSFQTVADGKYGSKGSNNQWNGMVGEIRNNQADIAAAPMTISALRKEALDFSTPFMTFDTTIITMRPKDGGAIPFDSAQDLADQSEIGYGMVKDGETHRFFKNATKQPFRKMWQYMSNNPNMLVDSIDDAIEKIRKADGKYAFIIEGTTADYWTNKDPCDLVRIDDEFHQRSYGFAVRKGDSLKGKINKAMKELKDEGEIEKMKNKWWNTDAKCSGAAASTYDVITHFTWTISFLVTLILSHK